MSWIHEVKLPIAASRLLMENSTEETADSLADKLEDELDKIENYVEQALYYSRIDSFSKDYFITEEPLEAIIKTCAKNSPRRLSINRFGYIWRTFGKPSIPTANGLDLSLIKSFQMR